MTIKKEIKRDNFHLFDLTIYQKPFDTKLSFKKELLKFSFSFCNLEGVVFHSILDDFYYISICTEKEYYIDSLEDLSYDIIKRYIVLPLPKDFIFDNILNTQMSIDYLQFFIDDFLINKNFPFSEIFIYDECSNDITLNRTFLPDIETIKFYLNYVFDTERYFIQPDFRLLHSHLETKKFKNSYLEIKQANLETSISDNLNKHMLINLIHKKLPPLFPIEKTAKKVFKNFLKSQFTSILDNNKHFLFNPDNISFGFIETQHNNFYLWIKTEEHFYPSPRVERKILIPIEKNNAFQYSTCNYSELLDVIIEKINTATECLILENKYNHPHFNFIYELNKNIKNEYLNFLLLNINEQKQYCINYKNNSNYVQINKIPSSQNLTLFSDKELSNFFQIPQIQFDQSCLVSVNFQKEHAFTNKLTNATYYFNKLSFLNMNDFINFDTTSTFISRKLSENILVFEDQIIGFIQQHKIFPITPIENQSFLQKRHKKDFSLEDFIDEQECMFNRVKYSLFYIEYLENNNIYKIGIMARNSNQNTLKEAQQLLNNFRKKDHS